MFALIHTASTSIKEEHIYETFDRTHLHVRSSAQLRLFQEDQGVMSRTPDAAAGTGG
jgi:hypothetical protein